MKFKVMTREHGDLQETFDETDEGIELANKRFEELTGQGFRAATGEGPTIVKDFDAKQDEYVFVRPIQGG